MNDKTLQELNMMFIDKIKENLILAQNGTLTPKEVEQFITSILQFVTKTKQEFEKLSDENIQTIKDSISYIQTNHAEHMKVMMASESKLKDLVTKEISNAEKTFNDKIKQAKAIIEELQAIEVKDGKDADEEKIVEDVIKRIPKVEPVILDNGEQIVQKINDIESIEDDYKIDAIHIKNLPKLVSNYAGTGTKLLSQLQDVNLDLNTLVTGQTLVYNATTGVWENGAGGGSSLSLETDGVANGSQTLLNLIGGTNITLTDDGLGGVTIDSTSGGDYHYTVGAGGAYSMNAGNNITVLTDLGSGSVVTGNYTSPKSFYLYDTVLMGNDAGALIDSSIYGTVLDTYIGNFAGYNDNSSGYNTGVGFSALSSNMSGQLNAALGASAGSSFVINSNSSSYFGAYSGDNYNGTNYDSLANIFIGNQAGVITSAATITGSVVIGTQSFATSDFQFVLGGGATGFNSITDGYFGSGVYSATPSDFTMHATGGDIATTDASGASLIFAGGIATGAGAGGYVKIQTSDTGTTGTTPQTLSTKAEFDTAGRIRFNKYGINTFAATPAYGIGVDASGYLVEYTAGTGTVTSVSGTTNRIVITGTATDPIIDIDAAYIGQNSITTLGTIGTGVWQGSLVTGQYGGTGVNNNGKTITLGGNFTTSGAFASTLTLTGVTNVTLPTTGTLATLAGTETLTNKSIVATQLTGTAYTFAANNTNATAAYTLQTFQDAPIATYSGTITWDGTPPSGTIISNQYAWSRIGGIVTLSLSIVYTNPGATNTLATFDLPSDCPTPANFGGLGSNANEKMYYGTGSLETSVTSVPSVARVWMSRNAANTAYIINVKASSSSVKIAAFTIQYRTS